MMLMDRARASLHKVYQLISIATLATVLSLSYITTLAIISAIALLGVEAGYERFDVCQAIFPLVWKFTSKGDFQ